MSIFASADILLPKAENKENWAVVACDQYSSAPEYWDGVYERVKDEPSTLHLILPEAWLNSQKAQTHQAKIRANMEAYLKNEVMRMYPDSFIYTERTLTNGSIRQGLVGALDLEAYDYQASTNLPVRATEATILERIPPRAKIRSQAILEFPHILLLQNDNQDRLFSRIQTIKDQLELLYDFDLMENGGHICGWLASGPAKAQIEAWIEEYETAKQALNPASPLVYAIGDGNHSLAAAKAVWETIRTDLDPQKKQTHPARYALAELENLHHEAQQFEPIHRILKNVDVEDLIASFGSPVSQPTYEIRWMSADKQGSIFLDASISPLPLAVLQHFLDAYLDEHEGEIDYIHGEEDLAALAKQPNSVGFFLPAISKDSLFETIKNDGSLPRKTFSMGHAHEKRYYLEGRALVDLQEED
ncbi:DUF1015 domain-containing protein [Erysipelotrichaceae bacterium RD49]|nr:DUF1015 domain-containing protein [Erysipelotrichaceae bacterium RD49]